VPGTYSFYCYVHGPSMSGTIIVSPSGTTTVSTTTAGTGTGSSTGGVPGAGTAPAYGAQPGATMTPGPSLLAGSAATALQLPSSERGRAVRGSLHLAPAAAGGRLEVQLFAKVASLASASHAPAQVRLGRLVRRGLQPGSVSFAVPINAPGRRALHRHRRLRVTVRIAIVAPAGASLAISRGVVMHV